MAEAAPAKDPTEEMRKKVAHWLTTKRYVDEPEVLPWYKKDLPEIKPHTSELLENYSNVGPAEVELHLRKVVCLLSSI